MTEKTTLQLVLDKQKEFQTKFGYNEEEADVKTVSSLIHTHAAFLNEETIEMLRELPYHKPWVDYSGLTNEEIVEKINLGKKEWMDMFIFLMNIAVFLKMDEAEIKHMYMDKNKLNIRRQEDPELGYVTSK